MAPASLPDPLPPAISRPPQHVQAVLTQSLIEMGNDGRAALAWEWAMTGTRPSPVTLSLPPGCPPTREEILAEAEADPEGSTAPPGAPTDFCDQIGEVRRVLHWLIGDSDEVPVDCEDRGELIGARGDYARTDDEIRLVRDNARRGIEALSGPPDSADFPVCCSWERKSALRDAAWFRGVCDLLDWVLGERPTSPMSSQRTSPPSAYDLSYESAEEAATMQRQLDGHPADRTCRSPQFSEAIQATIRWLRGERTAMPSSPYGGVSGADATHESQH